MTDQLAEPFSHIFTDRAEAEWAFDLLREAVRRLRVTDPYDPRVALTVSRRGERSYALRLNFGGWLVLGFRGPGAARVDLTLLASRVAWDERFESVAFERKEGEQEVRSYALPPAKVRPLTSDLQTAFFDTLDFIAAKFGHWKKATHWKQHQPEIIEALFDPDRRANLLAAGLAAPELIYERTYTAFGQELAEEVETYGVEQMDENVGSTGEKTQMKTIEVDALNGLKPEFQPVVFEAMKNCSNHERLLVCLYFLSELPDEVRTLDVIETNLRQIFPPSLGEGNLPDDYTNFQASAIRGYLGDYDRRTQKRGVPQDERLWVTFGRGLWRNTDLGNERAIEILRREGIRVEFSSSNSPHPPHPPHPPTPPLPLAGIAAETGFDEAELARWVRAIERKGQAVLYGPPGTGKTFVAQKLADHLIGGGDGFAELVQFHPAYAYEDFVQGIRPDSSGGQLSYPLVKGRFLDFCGRAARRRDRCVLIIDEINRANLARVFGELMFLLEYRDRAVPLAGGGELRIPANVRLIGTMNTADRSIALVDHALRRRFAFIALRPNFEALRRFHQPTGFPVEPLIATLTDLNRAIDNPDYAIGISFFLRADLADHLADIWQMEIEPYLDEYFFNQPGEVDAFRWDRLRARFEP